jgi:hypothetical protein
MLYAILGAWMLHIVYDMGRIRGIRDTIQTIYEEDVAPKKNRTPDDGRRSV